MHSQALRAVHRLGGAQPPRCLAPPARSAKDRIEDEMRRIRGEPPLRRDPTRLGPSVVPPEEEYRRYNEERERYFGAYEEYLRQEREDREAEALRFVLRMEVVNGGTATADDVDLALRFPDELWIALADRKRPVRTPPPPPRKPRTSLQIERDALSPGNFLSTLSPGADAPGRSGTSPPPDPRGLRGVEVRLQVGRIRHGYVVEVPPIAVTFGSREQVRGFTIHYRIHAVNLPDEVEGELHVRVDMEA